MSASSLPDFSQIDLPRPSQANVPPSRCPDLRPDQVQNISHQLLELHLGSVLLLTAQNKIIYASRDLCSLFQAAEAISSEEDFVPREVEAIGQILQQCREQFATQQWVLDFNILTKDAIALRIRSRWLKLSDFEDPCILLIVEDRQQLVQDIVLNSTQNWRLTPREQEVWLLHQDGHTYSKIAEKLVISKNTVKKHMGSIYAKRRAAEAG